MPYIGKQPANVPVTADDIPNDSITAAKIVDAAITIDDIGPNAVGNSEMADDAIGLNELSATGTTNSSTFLRGDNTWAVPPDNNTTYSVQDGQLSQNNFTDADHSKLNAIEASADVTDATNVSAAGALMKSGGTMTGTIAGFTSTGIDDNADATAITINSSEQVGIGTTSPTNNLHIKSAGNTDQNFIQVEDSDGNKALRLLSTSSTGDNELIVYNTSGSGQVKLNSNGHSYFNGGNVGIGTASPSKKLEIAVSGTDGVLMSGANGYVGSTNDLVIDMDSNNDYSGNVIKFTQHNGASELMRIADSGNVSIGATTSGSYKFLVSGTQFNVAEFKRTNNYGAIINVTNGTGTSLSMGMDDDEVRYLGSSTTKYLDFGSSGVNANFHGQVTTTGADMQLTTKSAIGTAAHEAGGGFSNIGHATQGSRRAIMWLDADGANFAGSDYYYIEKTGGGGVQHILQNSADMTFATNGTTRMNINANGNIGIGNTVAGTINGVNSSILTIGSGSGHSGMTVYTGATNEGTISFADGTSGSATYKGMVRYDHNTNNLTLHTDSSERMNINANGNIGIGESTPIRKVVIAGSSGNSSTLLLHMDADTAGGETALQFKGDSTNDDRRIKASIVFRRDDPGTRGTGKLYFNVNGDNNDVNVSTSHAGLVIDANRRIHGGSYTFETGHLNLIGEYGASYKAMTFSRTNGGGVVGSIVANSSSTSYNTSSDYRLKENVDYNWDATTRLKQLKPARFNWIKDDTNTLVDGFLAHEVSSIVPEAITGDKDAMKDEQYIVTPAVEEVKDEDGNITTEAKEAVISTRNVPDYQSIDQAKLVPLLVKTIQELEARITALES